jgi:hypothetical protein
MQNCDTLNTTALWDTLAGELHLRTLPRLAGSYAIPGYSYGVAVSGNYAYVANGFDGVQVMDISDPTNPTPVGSCDTPDHAYDVVVSGECAYVADRNEGLQVIDISDPSNPVIVGSRDTPDFAYRLAVSGEYAYVADRSGGVRIMNITDPTTPSLRGTYTTPGQARGIAISGTYAYVGDNTNGLVILDITNRISPVHVATCPTRHQARQVVVSGDYVYVADVDSGMQVIDVSDPATPVLVGSFNTPGSTWGLAVDGNRAYLADWLEGLQIVDITDPTNPTLTANYDTPGGAWGMAVSGCYAYVGDEIAGLQVVEVLSPVPYPTLAGSDPSISYPCGVEVVGEYAYVADYSCLTIIDISDPTDPVYVGATEPIFYVTDVAVTGDYAYALNNLQGEWAYRLIDISDPSDPVVVTSGGPEQACNGMAISGDRAYVSYSRALHYFDVWHIADPLAPGSTGECGPFDRRGHGVAVSGNYAYMANGLDGLQVIDVIEPLSPVPAATCSLPGWATDVTVDGDYAYVTSGYLEVVDISDPLSPIHVATYATPGISRKIAISGDWAFAAAGGSGLHLIDISDPTNPTFVRAMGSPVDDPYAVSVAGCHAYAADRGHALNVVEVFEQGFHREDNVAFSLNVQPEGSVDSVRITTSQTDSIRWEVHTHCTVWKDVRPGQGWVPLGLGSGDDGLYWRATLVCAHPGVNPTCSYLEIETSTGNSAVEGGPSHRVFSLSACTPNPFRVSTAVSFTLPKPSRVKITVNDVLGREVAVLVEDELGPGEYTEPWDGRNTIGEMASPGVYFVRMTAGSFEAKKKVALMR